MKRDRKLFGRFKRDSSGTLTVEAVLMFPLMFWLLIFGPITFDIVRERTAVLRNTYMIAKGVSLEGTAISDTFLTFTTSAFAVLFEDAPATGIRISEFKKNSSGEIELLWEDTNAIGFGSTLQSQIADYQDKLPYFITGECVLMVEGWRDYSSIIQWRFADWTLGWKDKKLYHRVFVRPRWGNCITRIPS